MSNSIWVAPLGLVAAVVAAAATIAGPSAPSPAKIADMDLSKPFTARSPWRFSATQGPPVDAADTAGGIAEDGLIELCLRRTASEPCDPALGVALLSGSKDDYFSTPHYLKRAAVVHGRAGHPLLLVQTVSEHAGDGGQLVLTQVLTYRRDADRFVRAYGRATGTNNNQEVRFIEAGPLKGDVISVEPTEHAPFGFWVTVNAPASAGVYRQVLRYRSATRYGDGNPLSAIDSEMPNIQRRLGLWRPGSPLPLPAGACPNPHLIRTELWCR